MGALLLVYDQLDGIADFSGRSIIKGVGASMGTLLVINGVSSSASARL